MSDHMLTTEQLEAIARSIRAGAVPGQDKLSALLRHVEALQQEITALHGDCRAREDGLSEAIARAAATENRAEAAQKRAERLRDYLLQERSRWERSRVDPEEPFIYSNDPNVHNAVVDAHIADIDAILEEANGA